MTVTSVTITLILIAVGIKIFTAIFKRIRHEKELYSQLDFLEHTIHKREQELIELENELETTRVDRNTNLNKACITVLDEYENANIKIPVEIIEDLSYNRLTEEPDIREFVENQRYFWRLENTKKPLKKKPRTR